MSHGGEIQEMTDGASRLVRVDICSWRTSADISSSPYQNIGAKDRNLSCPTHFSHQIRITWRYTTNNRELQRQQLSRCSIKSATLLGFDEDEWRPTLITIQKHCLLHPVKQNLQLFPIHKPQRRLGVYQIN